MEESLILVENHPKNLFLGLSRAKNDSEVSQTSWTFKPFQKTDSFSSKISPKNKSIHFLKSVLESSAVLSRFDLYFDRN